MRNLDLGLGRVGLGTFPFSGVFSPVSQESAARIVEAFVDAGGRYIETAPSYPKTVDLGAILSSFRRDRISVASKCVTATLLDGTKIRTGKYESVIKQCEDELKRLSLDYLDVFQAHITPEDVDPAETMTALSTLKEKGLVRIVGVSNVSLAQLKQFEKGGDVQLIQNRISIVNRAAYSPLMEHCREHDIHFNPYQVIERGQLATNTAKPSDWRPNDLRRSKAEYSGDAYLTIRNWFVEQIEPIAQEVGCTGDALSISWLLSRPMVEICVVGATSEAQVRSNVQAGSLIIPQWAINRIEQAYKNLANEVQDKFGLSVEEYRGVSV